MPSTSLVLQYNKDVDARDISAVTRARLPARYARARRYMAGMGRRQRRLVSARIAWSKSTLRPGCRGSVQLPA